MEWFATEPTLKCESSALEEIQACVAVSTQTDCIDKTSGSLKVTTDRVSSDTVWVISINHTPWGHVEEAEVEEVLWHVAKTEQERVFQTGLYSHVYIEPIDKFQMNLVAANNFQVVSYHKVVSTITCDIARKISTLEIKEN